MTTATLDRPLTAVSGRPHTIEKVAIVISKGSLEGIYPGLIMANGARMEGIEANVFFTFFGLEAIRRNRQSAISALATRLMRRRMEKLDSPPIPEFVELVSDSGAGLYACKASVDMFKLTKADFVEPVDEVLTVGEFYELAAGGEIIFT